MKTILFQCLTIYNRRGEPSVIDFATGSTGSLTVIYGPSDTGKTWALKCIGIALGRTWDNTLPDSYVSVKLKMRVGDAKVIIRRQRSDNNLEISKNGSPFEQIPISKSKEELNSKLSEIMDFNFDRDLIKNTRNERSKFSWLSLVDLFTYTSDIDSEDSILKGKQSYISTLTRLNYLFNGDVFDKYIDKKESDRSKSVYDYLNQRIKTLQIMLSNLDSEDGQNLENISDLLSHEDNLLAEIQKLNEQLDGVRNEIRTKDIEKNTVSMDIDKYRILRNQYNSKAQRMNFIADAIANERNSAHLCPICHSNMKIDLNTPELSSVIKEYQNNVNRSEELNVLLSSLENRYLDICRDYSNLKNLEGDLEFNIKQHKTDYAEVSALIKGVCDGAETRAKGIRAKLELESLQSQLSKNPEIKYEAFESKCINQLFKELVENELSDSLKKCFGYSDIKLDNQWNPILDNKAKSTHGSGYRGLINSLTLLAIAVVLKRNGSFPGFIIIDSPLTAFSENNNKSCIALRFLEYLKNCSKEIQIIIAENNENIANELETKYNDNTIFFTKSNNGRYGLLNDYSLGP
ncbi:hypothetical protein AR505_0873 [methanogenic archaeon ISO4-H5]|nr:hypothetical protein AR505_0873 [methanogenic archaeon ISO4-H5]